MTLGSQGGGSRTGDYLAEDTILRSYPPSSQKRHCCHNEMDGFSVIMVGFTVLTAAVTVALIIQINYGSPEVTPHGAVASDAQECSEVGVHIMRKGGTAVDVAVATLFCMSVIHPHVVGPGGSGVMLVHSHQLKSSTVIDFMTAIPQNHTAGSPQPLPTSGKSIGVPGFLKGLEYAHQKYGKISWSDLIQPSIDIARKGFSVSAALSEALQQANITRGMTSGPFARLFFPRGIQLQEGMVITRNDYAVFLEDVAKYGSKAMFTYSHAVEIVRALRSTESDVSVHDLHTYQVIERPSHQFIIRNRTIISAPVPFGGPQLLAALQMLDGSGIYSSTRLTELYQKFIEASRRSYIEYMKLADSDEQDTSNLTEAFLEGIFDETVDDDVVTYIDPAEPSVPDQAGTEVSVIDTFDMYVSAVVGLGTLLGSRVMTNHGILFNNHVSNVFRHEHGDHPHHHRPFTTYTPVIITDSLQVCGRRVVLGSSQVDAALQVAGHLIFRNKNMTTAIMEPRISVKPYSNDIFLDDLNKSDLPGGIRRLPGIVRRYLSSRNYTLTVLPPPYPSVNGVSKLRDTLVSHSDTRGGGLAARLDGHGELMTTGHPPVLEEMPSAIP